MCWEQILIVFFIVTAGSKQHVAKKIWPHYQYRSLSGIKGLPDRQIIPLQKVEWSLQQRRWRRKWAKRYHSKCGSSRIYYDGHDGNIPEKDMRHWYLSIALDHRKKWAFTVGSSLLLRQRYITGEVISVNGGLYTWGLMGGKLDHSWRKWSTLKRSRRLS